MYSSSLTKLEAHRCLSFVGIADAVKVATLGIEEKLLEKFDFLEKPLRDNAPKRMPEPHEGFERPKSGFKSFKKEEKDEELEQILEEIARMESKEEQKSHSKPDGGRCKAGKQHNGSYLERVNAKDAVHFYNLSVKENCLCIREGNKGCFQSGKKETQIFATPELAADFLENFVYEKVCSGYKLDESKFRWEAPAAAGSTGSAKAATPLRKETSEEEMMEEKREPFIITRRKSVPNIIIKTSEDYERERNQEHFGKEDDDSSSKTEPIVEQPGRSGDLIEIEKESDTLSRSSRPPPIMDSKDYDDGNVSVHSEPDKFDREDINLELDRMIAQQLQDDFDMEYHQEEKVKSKELRRNSNSKRKSYSQPTRAAESGKESEFHLPISKGSSTLGSKASGSIKVLLAKTWEENIDPEGWYLSEKLDGIRCYWNGSKMYTRNGNEIYCPKFFIEGFPESPLDGELWVGRDGFQQLTRVVRKKTPDPTAWENITYKVFDAPGLNLPFKERYPMFKSVLDSIGSKYLRCHNHTICKGREHLQAALQKVEEQKGEGLMLRNPDSYYEGVRSSDLLKVKTFSDAEATVYGYEEGEGRNQGRTGALLVRDGQGIEFKIGSGLDDKMREKPPKKGTKVTFKFQGRMESGKPRFPTFLRIYKEL